MKNTLLIFSCFAFFLFACNQDTGETATEDTTEATEDVVESEELSTDLIGNENTATESTPEAPASDAQITFEKYDHDFGQIKEGEVVDYTFKFTNTGSDDLIISEAKGTCGCTVPDWPKQPIKPGESSEIVVSYNSKGKKGIQRKSVHIDANTTPSRTTLNITSEVKAEEEGAS